MERRSFLKLSCGLGAGILLSSLGVSVLPIEAFAQELTKYDRIKTAKQSTSICCYCAVGCGLLCSTDTKTGKIINIEGDPEHPINEGSLCAKGAGIYQTTAANDRRLDKVLYRAPYGDKWEEKDWDFAIDRIARHLKEERDAGFVKRMRKGRPSTVSSPLPIWAAPTSTAKSAGPWPSSPAPTAWCTSITRPGSDTAPLYRLWQSRSDAAR